MPGTFLAKFTGSIILSELHQLDRLNRVQVCIPVEIRQDSEGRRKRGRTSRDRATLLCCRQTSGHAKGEHLEVFSNAIDVKVLLDFSRASKEIFDSAARDPVGPRFEPDVEVLDEDLKSGMLCRGGSVPFDIPGTQLG